VFHRNGKAIREDRFGREWRAARKKAKLPHKLLHDLRRNGRAGHDPRRSPPGAREQDLGPRYRLDFERYNITSIEDKLEALRRRGECVASQASASNVAQFPDSDNSPTI
jgi:hypothetical protein